MPSCGPTRQRRWDLSKPVRVEDAHQRRGLAACLVTEGARRLAAHGCDRLKVDFDNENETSRGATYEPGSKCQP
jgi:predicted N-acetyltransferase YhbS